MRKRMTFLEALRKASLRIKDDRNGFICFALDDVGGSRFRPRIMQQLDGSITYNSWVEKHHPEVYEQMEELGRRAFQKGRLAWIDNMIAIEESK